MLPWTWVVAAWAVDADGDGFPAGIDCDDTRADVHPGARETCDVELGIDEDCDGLVDDADPNVRRVPYWNEDRDADGHPGAFVAHACEGPPGAIRFHGGPADCDDADASVWNGLALWYPDADLDGWSSGSGWVQACHAPAQTGWIARTDSDCQDSDPTIHPQATEICGDGIDQDCAGGDEVCPWWDHTIAGATSGEGFGSDVVVVGDGTGDGLPDLWVLGARAGAAWSMPGPLTRDQPQSAAALTLEVEDPNGLDAFYAVVSAGDVDGDGLDELAFGVPGVQVGIVDRAGAVYIRRGGGTGTRTVDVGARTILEGNRFGQLGTKLAVGDWDGGGLALFASAPYDGRAVSNAGAILVTSTFPAGRVPYESVADARIEGITSGERLGEAWLLVADTDGDGLDDQAERVAHTDPTDADTDDDGL
ncbi:MAG: hypothetical protein KC621_32725, partial [Myxococcales bacterium]|nr:hypothetical protein [Myxococcales bacterium]